MARKVADPQTIADNYVKGMGTAADKYRKGIARVTVNPMQQAATPEAMARYVDGVQRSVTSGKRAAKLNAVPMSRWQQNATTVGANRLTDGATKAKDKVLANAQKWAPIWQQISDSVAAMPKGGLANAQARANAAIAMSMNAAGTA